jgi:hypothetical protein
LLIIPKRVRFCHTKSRKTTLKNRVLLGIASIAKMGLFCIINSTTMQLMMYIGNDLIEAVTLDKEKIQKPGYVGQFKRTLKMKYNELIRQYANPPEFLVSAPAIKTASN